MTDNEMLQAMFNEIKNIRSEVKKLDAKISNVENEVKKLDAKISNVENEVKKINVTLEQVINRNIEIIAEGHKALNEKNSEVLATGDSIEL